jgi:hypothetical protein
MNTKLTTTGLVPLVATSIETFQLSSFLNELPWDLTGGTVTLFFLDPAGNLTSVMAAVVGTGAVVVWTVPATPGTWSRAWLVVDSIGRTQKSLPIVFTVTNSP